MTENKISAKIIADSINEFKNRITTMVITMPRIILAEFNTHRMFSRNSASSRAIPFEKMVKSVEKNPFIPIAWQKDHSGMQGSEYFNDKDLYGRDDETLSLNVIKDDWLKARDYAVEYSTYLNNTGVTKQICNRLLEPFMWHTVIVTATEWENFFALRCPKYSLFSENMPMDFRSKKNLLKYVKEVEAEEFKNQYDNLTDLDWLQINKGQAEIHIMALAEAMWDAYNESAPKELKEGEWHIPFGDNLPKFINKELGMPEIETLDKVKIATARCARVSYTVIGEENKPANYENDIKLHDRLLESGHFSPFEHCAKAIDAKDMVDDFGSRCWSGNFRGFIQYRKMIENK